MLLIKMMMGEIGRLESLIQRILSCRLIPPIINESYRSFGWQIYFTNWTARHCQPPNRITAHSMLTAVPNIGLLLVFS